MKIELSDTELDKVVKALEWYYFYTLAQKREDGSFRDLADRLKKKEPHSETRVAATRMQPILRRATRTARSSCRGCASVGALQSCRSWIPRFVHCRTRS